MAPTNTDMLKPWARKYIWWKTPTQAVQHPQHVIAQVMNIGDYDDVQQLIDVFGETSFRQAIAQAQPGQFNERSWAYWHYRLGLSQPGHLPPMPKRHVS